MRRPASLRGQILLAVLLALAAAQAFGVIVAVQTRQQAVRAAQISDAFDRAAALVYVLERTDPDLHANLLRAAETPLTRLSVAPTATLAKDPPGLNRARRRLLAALDDPQPRDIRMALSAARSDHKPQWPVRDPSRHRAPPAERIDPQAMLVSIPLVSGDWLNAQIRFPRPERGLLVLPLVSFVLAALAIGLALWLTLARLLGPLRRLAAAAESLGRGEAMGALPATGPSEMRALTEAFNLMQQRLHRMVSDRTQMLAALGHDLRSPLTALRVRAEMVDDDETRERILVSLDEMQDMVEQTLTYARGVWTSEAVETVDAGDLLRALAAEDDRRAVDLSLPPTPVTLRVRPATLRRALRNLLDNAHRYGGGTPQITLERQGELAVITIRDRGPGIPQDDLSRMFDPFVRIEASRSRETGGTGLGLSIARSIVQAHGGEVTLANRAGGGLAARITLPAADSQAEVGA